MPATDLQQFATEAAGFIAGHYRSRNAAAGNAGENSRQGSDKVSVIPERSAEEERVELAAALAWRATLFDAGYGWIDGPTEYGGQGLSAAHAAVFRDVEQSFAVPDEGYTRFSAAIFSPTLLQHGSPALAATYLAALRRADIVACQLFSEPEAGSDLAAVRTRAIRDGDDWLLTGQKVWTSGANYSQVGMVLARTDSEVRKHAGLTVFLLDMDQPGVEVRPIKQMTGGASFSEVFLTGARVADSHRIGAVDGGWPVITTTLMHERAVIGADGGIDVELVPRLVRLAQETGAWQDAGIRDAIAEIHVRATANQAMTQRFLRLAGVGNAPGPEMSISKLLLTDNLQRISAVAQRILGPRFTTDTGEWGTFGWSQLALTLPGLRIGGGTDEVLRTIVAQRVLGLPRS